MNVRRTVVLSEETDRALRAYLGRQGIQKGDLSRFIEEAIAEGLVRRVLGHHDVTGSSAQALLAEAVRAMNEESFEATVACIKARTAGLDEDEVMSLIDEALEHSE